MIPLINRIEALIIPSMESMGFGLVQVKMMDGDKRKTLQILAEGLEGRGITIDDCAKISRTLSALLDVEDVIHGEFNLEVSSPGIDRPLFTKGDFERYTGFEAKIETALPIEGRRRFKGPILGVEGFDVRVQVDAEQYLIPIDNIQNAKLVLTDALLKAHKPAPKTETETTD